MGNFPWPCWINIIQKLRTRGPGFPSSLDQEDFAAAREKVKAWDRSVLGVTLWFIAKKGGNYRWKLRKHPETEIPQLPFCRAAATNPRHSHSIVTHLPSIYTRLSILGPHVPSILDDGHQHGTCLWVMVFLLKTLHNTMMHHDASHVLCENESKSVTHTHK